MRFCQVLGERVVTEFNYRYSDINSEQACIFVGVRLNYGVEECAEIVHDLQLAGYDVANLSHDEMAQTSCTLLVGGRQRRLMSDY